MKKTILPLLALLVICITSNAQFKVGQVLLGGSLSFGISNSSPYPDNGYITGNIFNINPTIGIFKNNRTLYSFGLIYGHSMYNYPTSIYGIQKNVGNNYGINLSKQCFTPIAKNLFFTIAGTFTGLYQDYKISYDQNSMYNSSKSGFFAIGVAPGMSYKINNWLLCDLSLPNLLATGFSTGERHVVSSAGVDAKTTYNNFSFSTNLNSSFANNLAIGFRFMLGNKME